MNIKSHKPVFSIITVVYNNAKLLELTIKSVASQTWSGVEYIVVDGGSTDGTLDTIRKWKTHIHQWISEPDNGLYDAMNKGLRLATGDYVWFVNAGDEIFAPYTIEQIANLASPKDDVLYGEVMLVDAHRRPLGTRSQLTTQKLPLYLDWQSLQYGMVVCHQGFIARRTIAPLYRTDNLAADIDWVIRVLKKSRKNTYVPDIFANYLIGGISKQRHLRALLDRYKILHSHYGAIPNLLNHSYIALRAMWHKLRSVAQQSNL